MPAKSTRTSPPATKTPRPHRAKPSTYHAGGPVGPKVTYEAEITMHGQKPRRLGQSESPWQRMIEEARIAMNVSLRSVAEATGGLITYNGLWQWTRSKAGHPNPRRYTKEINAALARALGLDPDELLAAFTLSKLENGINAEDHSAISDRRKTTFRKLVAEGKATWTKREILDLLDLCWK